jgi:ABC-type glycerol-3-phosphate transport system substrate-binding protein
MRNDPAAGWRNLREGRCAMAMAWPAGKDAMMELASVSLGFAPLPGGRDVYNFRESQWEQRLDEESFRVPLVGFSGRLAAVTRESRNPTAAMNLVLFLCDPETGARISGASPHTTLYRESHVSQPDAWIDSRTAPDVVRRYAATVKAVLNEPMGLISLRIPARHRYMAALDESVRAAVSGTVSPQEALSGVANHWNEITMELGREAQRAAYMHSLGLE